MEKAKGGDYGGRAGKDGRMMRPSNGVQTLADLGISKDQSSKWQQLAAVQEAERRAGQLLTEMAKAKASPGNQYTGKVDRSHDTTGPTTLAELGISKDQSSKWQQLAAVPEAEFEAVLAGPAA